jgi:hypothetical protein
MGEFSVDPDADAALIKLCDEALNLDDEIVEVLAKADDILDAPTGDLWKQFDAKCAEVARTRATTLHGMQAKAIVLKRWLLAAPEEDAALTDTNEEQNLAWSLASDLLQLPA